MHILYMIFIYPLEFLMKTILEFSHSAIDNYGLSIIILSIIVNIALLPLYYMAEKWKIKDKAIQDSMKPEIDNIKKYYKGQERHFYIQTIYRRHGYHPLSSIKASVGFLIQIPFFFAAFHLLSNYQALNGVSFGILQDLGSPDHIINGINVLPIVMTIVNLLSAYIYIELLNKSEKIQLFALAFIFLVVLYNEPAGLLLYWTMNNIFSLIKNVVEKKFKAGSLFAGRTKTKKPLLNRGYFQAIYEKTSVPIWFFILILAIGLDRIYSTYTDKTHSLYLIESIIIFFYLNSLLVIKYFSMINKRNVLVGLICIPLSVIIIIFISKYILHIPISMLFADKSFLLPMIFLSLLFLHTSIFIDNKYHNVAFFKGTGKSKNYIITISILIVTYFIFIFSAVQVISSSPLEFNGTSQIFIILSVLFVFSSLILKALTMQFKKAYKDLALFASLFFVLYFLTNLFLFPGDYGLMDFFIFAGDVLAISKEMIFYDIATVIVLLLISFLILRYIDIEKTIKALTIVMLSLFLSTLPSVWKIMQSDYQEIMISSSTSPEGGFEAKYKFSKEGKNVLIIFFDRFIGGYVKEVIKDVPELESDLSGFKWYSNTISSGSTTVKGLPPIYAGLKITEQYKDQEDRWEKYTDFMLSKFSKKGYHAFISDPGFLNPRQMKKISDGRYDFDYLIHKTEYMKYFYGDDIKKLKEERLKPRDLVFSYIIPFSIFKIAPPISRNRIYRQGKWLDYNGANNGWISSYLFNLSFLKSLPLISTVDSEIKGSYNFVTSMLTHDVYAARDNGKVQQFIKSSDSKNEDWEDLMKTGDFNEGYLKRFKDNYSIVHFFADKEALIRANEWFKWMKKNGVYNNTKIIIVSDHGRGGVFNPMLISQTNKKGLWYNAYMPLLMVKDFNESGDLKEYHTFMTLADVPSLALSAINDNDSVLKYDKEKGLDLYLYGKKRTLTVKKNIFNPKNWIYTNEKDN